MELLYEISNKLYEGELFVVPVLLILFLLLKKRTKITAELLISYNYLKLFLITLSVTTVIIQLACLYLQTNNNGDFITFQYKMSGPYSWSYWLLLAISLVFLILLCFKRWRLNPWFSFAIFFVSNAGLWMERLIIFISSLYRDYLPSSWSVSYNIIDPLVSSFAFLTVLFLILTLRKRKLLAKTKS